MKIFHLLWLLILFSTCQSECGSGNFGRNCLYSCNCEQPCNTTTGYCVGQICKTPWSGPTCQKLNVAFNKSVQQDDTHAERFPASNAVDGNTDGRMDDEGTCIHTKAFTPTAWWRVNIGQIIPIKSVRIYDRTNGLNKQRIRGYQIYVTNNTNTTPSGTLCFTRQQALPIADNQRIYDQDCVETGQYLTIYLSKGSNTILDFCEVEVFVCSNGTYGQDCENQCGYCLNDTICDQVSGICPDGCSAGWQGNNCSQACESGFYGINCQDKCGNCYQNEYCSRFDGSCPNGCSPGFKGSLCKTVCEDGKYGMNCKYECGKCSNGTICNSTTGVCEQGCGPGYKTVFCNETCTDRTYGQECRNSCGECLVGESCNHVNGICDNGCNPGYYPPFCQQECINNTYGKDCKETCGMCDKESQCNKTTGVCEFGCVKGYYPDKCKKKCINNTYGKHCNETCGMCDKDSQCNAVNGTCPSGCMEGYIGRRCKEKCQKGWYGKDCKERCGKCLNGNMCNYKSGKCESGCEIGYSKERCKTVCDLGTYGRNCNKSCPNCVNKTCHHVHGLCDRCIDGWQGTTCQERIKQPDTSNAGIISGIVVAVLVVLALLCIVIYKIRQHKSGKPENENGTEINELKKSNRINNPLNGSTTKKQGTSNIEREKLYVNNTFRTNPTIEQDNANLELNETILNSNFATQDKSIPLNKLKAYVDQMIRSEELEKEFKEIPKGNRFPCTEGEKKINKEKNRFKTTFPYDHSRVVIPVLSDQHSTDYINANYIDSVTTRGMYIATQGPKICTIWDFWSMVWTQNSGKIIMLTDLIEGHKKKCDKYWPDIDESISSKHFQLSFREEQEHSVYVVRILQLINLKTNESRNIQQYHFTRWPDHGVPDPFQLLQFHRHVLRGDDSLKGPMIVHCSAGLGRTGTFIGLDALLESGWKTQKVDIRSFVEKMRHNRMDMIQTDKQYIFLHQALLEAFAILNPSVSKDNFIMERIEGSVDYPKSEYLKLKEMENTFNVEDYKSALFQENVKKNRTRNVLPADAYRPYLSSYISGGNDYINAVIVPDCCRKFGFIVTQLPLECTVCDFWRLLLDHESYNVICLESPSKDGKPYWPTNGETFEFDSRLFVTSVGKVRKENGFTVHKFTLKYKGSSEDTGNITLYELASSVWLDGDATPTDLSPLLQLQDIVYRIQLSDKPKIVTVQCFDGASRCGLACAIFSTIERMRMDGDINVYHTVRQLQIHCPQLVNSEAQYRYCYEAVKEYLNSSSIYGNM